MYKPFVRACNYALEALSAIDVNGMPKFSMVEQIVFVCNHNRSVHSENHLRESQVKPDVVLLRWNRFEKDEEISEYSRSYQDATSVSKNLTWRAIRSTVEMKFAGLPKKHGWTRFNVGFEGLEELTPHTPLNDAIEPAFSQERQPANYCECGSFSGLPWLIFPDRRHPQIDQTARYKRSLHVRRLCRTAAHGRQVPLR